MPRGKRRKKDTTNIDIQVVLLIVVSIILAILIYTQAGEIGKELTPILRWIDRMGKVYFTTPARLL